MICSVLIPSRKRVERLKRAIASFFACATGADWDIRIRLDDDDRESLAALPEIQEHCFNRVVVTVGPRLGWSGCEVMFAELGEQSPANWVWLFNDDALVTGTGWDQKLIDIPTTGVIVQPEMHRLGGSGYPNDPTGPFPIIPNRVWKLYGLPHIPHPADAAMESWLRKGHGWQTQFLNGIGIHHQRDNDQQIAEHRK